jgi:hypothetical protein
MALFPANPGLYPLGLFDVSDAVSLSSITGGEVGTLTTRARTNSASEKAAADVLDGYTYATPGTRPAVTLATTNAQFPLFLLDDGTAGYGSFFGQVIGAPVGLSTTGSDLGPHSAAASGKVTAWDKPGLYVVTLDSCASDFVSSLLAGTSGLAPGAVLGFNASSKLAHAACSGAVVGSGVGHFVEFEASPSLVTTPGHLVGAAQQFTRVKVQFHAGLGIRTL